MLFVIDTIMSSKYYDKDFFKRSRLSYYVEWFGHNYAYRITSVFLKLGYLNFSGLNESAKHVNLDENESMIVWYFIYFVAIYSGEDQ